MSAGNAIQGSFGCDLTPLQRDFAQAEQMARASAGKVSAALNSVQSPRGRYLSSDQIAKNMGLVLPPSLSERVRRNSAAGFLAAPKGKYPSPLDADEGIAGGVTRTAFRLGGVLTFVHAIAQLGEAYKQAGLEAYKLGVENDNLARPQNAFSSAGVYEQRLQAIATARAANFEKTRSEQQSFLSKMKAGWGVQMNQLHGYGTPGQQGLREFQNRIEQSQRAAEALGFMADNQNRLNEAEREGTQGSERQGALLRARAEHMERLAAISELASAAGVKPGVMFAAENERLKLEEASINRRANLRALEQTMTSKMLGLTTGPLTPALQNIAGLQERMKFLREKFAGSTEEDAVDVGNEMGRTDLELLRARYSEKNKPWSARALEMRGQRRFQRFAEAQSPSNPNAYLTHADAYGQTDILGNRTTNRTGPRGQTSDDSPSSPGDRWGDVISAINHPDWVNH